MWFRRRKPRTLEDLTPKERSILRDIEAYCAGSADVSREEAEARARALTPREHRRVRAVIAARMEESARKWERRKRSIDNTRALLQEWVVGEDA